MTHPHPQGYVDAAYLQTVALLLQEAKERSDALMRVQPGQQVLDVGCGPGTDTLPLAHLVGPDGRVVGVDTDAAMLAEGARRAATVGVAGWVQHQRGDVMALPFAASSFDACRAERVLQHVADPARALRELVRVTKPGGWVVVNEPDWGLNSIATHEVEIERRLARMQAERCIRHGSIGRDLFRLDKEQGLHDVALTLVPLVLTDYARAREVLVRERRERVGVAAGLLSAAEVQRWRTSLEQAAAAGAFFAAMCRVLIAGQRLGAQRSASLVDWPAGPDAQCGRHTSARGHT